MSAKQMDALRQQFPDVGEKSGMSIVETGEMLARQIQGSMSFNDERSMLPYMMQLSKVMGAARHFVRVRGAGLRSA